MSSTNRGGKRSPADFYSTPFWCVQLLLDAIELPPGQWLEPAAGSGAIIAAVDRSDVTWTAWELREEQRSALSGLPRVGRVHIGDFLQAHSADQVDPPRYVVAITNPPFSLAESFVQACIARADKTIMLLRLNFLASRRRHSLMASHTPDVYVLPNRPSFTGGRTDSIEYAWFVWSRTRRSTGSLQVLGLKR